MAGKAPKIGVGEDDRIAGADFVALAKSRAISFATPRQPADDPAVKMRIFA